MTSQFNLTQFYDVIIRNSVFQLGFLTREFQIPSQVMKNAFYFTLKTPLIHKIFRLLP